MFDFYSAIHAALARRDIEGATSLAASWSRTPGGGARAQQTCGDLALVSLKLPEADRHYSRALDLDPSLWQVWNNLSNVKRYLGDYEGCERCFRQAIAICPDPLVAARIHSGFIIQLHGDPGQTQLTLSSEIHRWVATYASDTPVSDFGGQRREATPLRVAYVSGSFDGPIINRLLPGIVGRHDRDVVSPVLVNTNARISAPPQSFVLDDVPWLNLPNGDPAGLGRLGAIDIAVDLDGHSPTGCPLLFARRIAPIQVSWLDWFNTTGLATMDYFIGDDYSTPATLHANFSEKVINLPQFRLCYEPPNFAPEVVERARTVDGSFVFGAFSRVNKHNRSLLSLWGLLLNQSNNSILLFKDAAFDSVVVRDRYYKVFAQMGVAADRLRFLGRSAYVDHLAALNQVDLMLDTLPYNGGVSSFDALCMGLACLTVAGETTVARQTAAIMVALSLDAFVANSHQEYVSLAVSYAEADLPIPQKQLLRDRFLSSSLCNQSTFFSALEQAFVSMRPRDG